MNFGSPGDRIGNYATHGRLGRRQKRFPRKTRSVLPKAFLKLFSEVAILIAPVILKDDSKADAGNRRRDWRVEKRVAESCFLQPPTEHGKAEDSEPYSRPAPKKLLQNQLALEGAPETMSAFKRIKRIKCPQRIPFRHPDQKLPLSMDRF